MCAGCGRTVLQQIQPPGIVIAHHPHVVGDHVEDESHPVFLQPADKSLEFRCAAEFGIEAAVLDDVVAVAAAGTGL